MDDGFLVRSLALPTLDDCQDLLLRHSPAWQIVEFLLVLHEGTDDFVELGPRRVVKVGDHLGREPVLESPGFDTESVIKN